MKWKGKVTVITDQEKDFLSLGINRCSVSEADSRKENATLTKEEMRRAGKEMLYLTACALSEKAPDVGKVSRMNLLDVYKMCQFHNMTGVVACALENLKRPESIEDAQPEKVRGDSYSVTEMQNTIRRFLEAKAKAIRKNILLDTERNSILQFMEQRGIWYLPLKGILLKDLYPKLGMRQMADNDILFDENYQQEVMEYMQSRGYTTVSVGKGNHDVYQKPPVYNFEFHTSLFEKRQYPVWTEYYKDVRSRLILDAGRAYGYHFRDEDFYIYITIHAYKHYQGSGTGLRSLMDCYVYEKAKGKYLDWKYIYQELEKLGVAEYERECRNLSRKIFTEEEERVELTRNERDLLDDILYSGTYGTQRNRISKQLKELQADQSETTNETRLKYIAKRMFPDQEFFRVNYPFFYEHKWLLPFAYPYRIVKGLIQHSGKLCREFKLVWRKAL